MKTLAKQLLLLCTLLLMAHRGMAEINIFACEPEWGALANELGGKQVNVYNATTAYQDPHHVQARPSLISKMRRADLLVCTGAELEIGWLPLLLRQAGNSRVQPGQLGSFYATDHVSLLDKPSKVDRAQGDVHASGNPHIQTDPRNMLKVARVLADRLVQIDNAHADDYKTRFSAFEKRWLVAMERWQQQATPLRGIKIIVHHKEWVYLLNWLSMQQIGTLEPKPGVPPSAGHLARLTQQLQQQPASMVIRAAYQDASASEWLQQHAAVKAIELPFTVGGSDRASDLFGLYDDTIDKLLKGAQ